MADRQRLKTEIAELASRPRNVRSDELNRFANQLKLIGHKVSSRPTSHGVIYQIEGATFHVCTHNPGSSQVKKYCVEEFLAAMAELDLYDEVP